MEGGENMATEVIHEHTDGNGSNSMGMILGMILLVILVLFAFYFFGILGRSFSGFGTNTPQVNVPSKMDVNVHGTGK